MRIPLLLTLAGLLAAFLPVTVGLPDLPLLLPLAVLAGGAAWGTFRVARGFAWKRLALAVAQVLVLAATAVWAFALSGYDHPAGAAAVGSAAPAVTLERVRDGALFRTEELRGRNGLLVFFRGPG